MLATEDTSTGMEGEPGWPLLHLPGPAHQALVASLPVDERRSLRLACKAATALVDRWAIQLRMRHVDLHSGGAALQQRYPMVAQLVLQCGQLLAGARTRLLETQLWPAVTAVSIKGGELRGAVQLLASFPCVKECCLEHVALPHPNEMFVGNCWGQRNPALGARFLLQEVLSSLPASLTSLSFVSGGRRLNSEQLEALALVPVLTQLSGEFVERGDGACNWGVMGRMQALRSLIVRRDVGAGIAAAHLRELTLLTHLEWHGSSELQLPTSLVQLDISRLPAQPLQLPAKPLQLSAQPLALPCLKDWVLRMQPLEHQGLARLAACCPQLSSIQIEELFVHNAGTAVQLTALTQLRVRKSLSSEVQLCSMFPRLQELQWRCARGCHTAAALAPLKGLMSLMRLDVGTAEKIEASNIDDILDDFMGENHGTTRRHGAPLQLPDFKLLAQLPALSSLRLDMTTDHVAGVALLTQLHGVEWVWDYSEPALCRTCGVVEEAALSIGTAPAQLRTAAVCCIGRDDWAGDGLALLTILTDAVISWLARAQGLKEVRWFIAERGQHRMLTAQRLAMLAASNSIRRVVVDLPIDEAAMELRLAASQLTNSLPVLRIHD